MGTILQEGNGNALRFLQSLVIGQQALNDKFNLFTRTVQEDVRYNGRKIYLTKRLNDLYDVDNRGIYVVTNYGISTVYIYRIAEAIPTYIYRKGESLTKTYVPRIGELGTEYIFTVYVPSSLVYDSEKFNATIKRYVAAGVTYNIETY